MKTALRLLILLSLVGGFAYFGRQLLDRTPQPVQSQPNQANETRDPLAPDSSSSSINGQRQSVPTQDSPAQAAAAEPIQPERKPDSVSSLATSSKSHQVRGRVLDLTGQGLADLVVLKCRSSACNEAEEIALTQSDGSFEFEFEQQDGHRYLTVETDDWTTLRSPAVRDTYQGQQLTIVVDGLLLIEGRVVDASGAPIEGCKLGLTFSSDTFRRLEVALDANVSSPSIKQQTDAQGSFRIERAPRSAISLNVRHEDYKRQSLTLDTANRRSIQITLEANSQHEITGQVLHADGTPAVGALVRFEDEKTTSDRQGHFTLPVNDDDHPESSVPLIAALDGFQACLLDNYGELLHEFNWQQPPVTLQLGPPTLSITGRVLRFDGQPAKSWQIQLRSDSTNSDLGWGESIETFLGGPESTGSDGGFEIRNLLDRDYTVAARDTGTFLQIISEPIPAGSQDVILQLPKDSLHEALKGVVVSKRGRPLEGLVVEICQVLEQSDSGMSWTSRQDKAQTDVSGEFQLNNVPTRNIHLNVKGDGIVPHSLFFEDGTPEHTTITVAERCHFRIELGDQLPLSLWNSRFQINDEAGNKLPMYTFSAHGSSSSSSRTMKQVMTETTAVSELAHELIVGSPDNPDLRMNITLQPGVINIVKLQP